MDKNNSYVGLLIDSLQKKKCLLEEIVNTNARLKEVVANSKFDPDVFDAIGQEKSVLVEEINKLDSGFEVIYSRVKDELPDNKDKYAQEIKQMQELIREIVALSTSIEADEQRIKADVEKQFSKIKQAVKQTRKNSSAVNNYYKSMQKIDTQPQFMDKKK